jgi:uncharacterized protein (DUF983 family)
MVAPRQRPPFRRALETGLRRRCPNCGEGRVIERWPNKIRPECPVCGLFYFREPGYYIGGMIFTYGITAGAVIIVFLITLLLPDSPNLSTYARLGLWIAFAIPVMLVVMPYAYSLWLSVDFWLDPWKPSQRD